MFALYHACTFTRRPVAAYAKARLCEAYTNGEDFVEIARTLKVIRVTAFTIFSRLNRLSSMSHGGYRYQKVDDEMRACAVDRNVENLGVELLNLKGLPKYSPILNPAENAISCWKAEFKKQIAQRQREFIDISDEMRTGRVLNGLTGIGSKKSEISLRYQRELSLLRNAELGKTMSSLTYPAVWHLTTSKDNLDACLVS